MEAINQALQPIVEVSGLPIDHVKLVLYFLTITPVAWIQWGLVRGTVARHLFSLLVGLFFSSFVFGTSNTAVFCGISIVPFLMLRYLPRTNLSMPVYFIGFGVVFAFQIKRQLFPGPRWEIDNTGQHMIACLKYISLAYNMQDSATIRTHPKKIAAEQRQYLVDKPPSLLEYYSYMCFFPTFLVGPVIEFRTYMTFIKRQDHFATIPAPFKESLTRMLHGLLLMTLVVSIGSRWSYAYLITDEFYQQSFFYKIGLFWLLGEANRLRFYLAWKFCEAGAVAAGLGYRGTKSTGPDWDGVKGINVLGCELAPNVKLFFDNWNISVADWLRRYCYNRIVLSKENPSQKWRSLAQHSTFVLSAVWHGLHPGYLIFFVNCSILGEVNKMVYVSDFSYLPGYKYLRLIAPICNSLVLNHIASSFVLLSFNDCYLAFASVSFIPILSLYALRVALMFVGGKGKAEVKAE
jgi:lysophospholipid acyltransferase